MQLLEPTTWDSVEFSKRLDLPRQAGIYAVIGTGCKVLYVGQATEMRKRWATHALLKEIQVTNDLKIAYRQMYSDRARMVLEAKLLLLLRPPMNKALPATRSNVATGRLLSKSRVRLCPSGIWDALGYGYFGTNARRHLAAAISDSERQFTAKEISRVLSVGDDEGVIAQRLATYLNRPIGELFRAIRPRSYR